MKAFNKPKWNGKDYIDMHDDIYLSHKNLTELPVDFSEADPDSFNGFYCGENKLTSLKGLPKEINGSFDVGENLITNLIGSPEKVGSIFSVIDNPELVSLEGTPKEVGGNFIIIKCPKLFNISNIVNIKIGGAIYYDYNKDAKDTPLTKF